jgi:hypothetical protein
MTLKSITSKKNNFRSLQRCSTAVTYNAKPKLCSFSWILPNVAQKIKWHRKWLVPEEINEYCTEDNLTLRNKMCSGLWRSIVEYVTNRNHKIGWTCNAHGHVRRTVPYLLKASCNETVHTILLCNMCVFPFVHWLVPGSKFWWGLPAVVKAVYVVCLSLACAWLIPSLIRVEILLFSSFRTSVFHLILQIRKTVVERASLNSLKLTNTLIARVR